MRKRNGDTLIEVTLAVGIFSLVAIAVVAVVNSSASGAQTALETTLAREEIDTQAEALRFIQSSYINSNTVDETRDNSNPQHKYKILWETIKNIAKTPSKLEDLGINLNYQPKTCQSLYEKVEGSDGNNTIMKEGAFIIDPQKLDIDISDKFEDSIIISANKNSNDELFAEASTYPHIVYGEDNEADSLISDTSGKDIYKVEGLYVIAVEGPQTLVVEQDGSTKVDTGAAYYDFYIRSCWYESGATQPTTISTLMRLYNPDVVKLYPKED